MDKNYVDITKNISANLKKLRNDIPDTMKGFALLAQAATRDGALDKKTKELIALALGVAAHCDGCIGFHTEALVKLEKGKMTETPVKSQFGWHIIRLDDVRQAELPKLEEVKPQVAQQLQQQKLAKFQEDLRAKAKVE